MKTFPFSITYFLNKNAYFFFNCLSKSFKSFKLIHYLILIQFQKLFFLNFQSLFLNEYFQEIQYRIQQLKIKSGKSNSNLLISRKQLIIQNDQIINYKNLRMNELKINQYIQKIIQPLYSKIQQLQKQNNDLKKRVTNLQSHMMSQSSRSYMKSTQSRQHQIQGSRITRRDDDNRSVSGSKQKPGWKSNTKIQEPKQISKEPVHHDKIKLKPPIPRMTSKTPTKTIEQANRQKSPPIDKKIIGGKKVQAEKKQIQSLKNQITPQIQNVISPRANNSTSNDFDDPSASRVSKNGALKLGKPNIYIQKQSKLNSLNHSPRQTPLERSSVTQKPISQGSDVTQQNSSPKLAKSQLSINSQKKVVKVEVTN